MNVAKSLWASVQGNPVFMRRVNGYLTLFWIAMIPISYERGWLKSIVYVSRCRYGRLSPVIGRRGRQRESR
jgi:hypothetical protein